MKKTILKEYAKLAVRTGANVQKGQDVVISASVDQGEFVSYVVEEAYKAGARTVQIDWEAPSKVIKAHYKYQSLKTLSTFEKWQIEKLSHRADTNPARIHIISSGSNELKGLNQKKLTMSQMKRYPIIKPFIDKSENQYQWTIIGVPGKEWAKEVYPELRVSQAMEKLWDAILKMSRVTSDPVAAWKEHNKELEEHCKYLNSLNLDYLEYKNKLGTDFKVWLSDEVLWLGGGETSLKGIYYNPNIPTEECFTTPIKGKAEGKVVATKPLSFNGQLIEDFYFVFKDGKVVEAHAEKGNELLQKMISMDENAAYIGECALVPFESPVNQTGTLFYNTLYDENAVCHIALGRGFTSNVKDFDKKTKEDFDRIGINDSMIHEDFMIGSEDLSITGTTRDGKKIKIFENGTWAK